VHDFLTRNLKKEFWTSRTAATDPSSICVVYLVVTESSRRHWPVIAVVVYHCRDRWTSPTALMCRTRARFTRSICARNVSS